MYLSAYFQEDEASIEVMYSEMADLLTKLDGQMHELHQYYSQRPELYTLALCDKVCVGIRMT